MLRAAVRVFAAAAFFFCIVPAGAQEVPDRTMHRLLLVDAERMGARIVAAGDRGYIVITDDHGGHWRRAKAPEGAMLTALHFVDGQSGFAAGHDSRILVTRDGGETWTLQYSAPAEQRPFLDGIYLDRDFAIAVGAYGLYADSGDGGKTWQVRKIIADDKHLNAIIAAGSRLLIVGEAGTILASDDRGKSWTPMASPYKGSFFNGLVAQDGAILIFGMRGRIFRSADLGATWQAVDNPSTATLIGGDKFPDGTLVLAGSAGTVLVSRDNGRSFVPLATGTTRALAKAILGGPGEVMLLGEGGASEVPLPSPKAAP